MIPTDKSYSVRSYMWVVFCSTAVDLGGNSVCQDCRRCWVWVLVCAACALMHSYCCKCIATIVACQLYCQSGADPVVLLTSWELATNRVPIYTGSWTCSILITWSLYIWPMSIGLQLANYLLCRWHVVGQECCWGWIHNGCSGKNEDYTVYEAAHVLLTVMKIKFA